MAVLRPNKQCNRPHSPATLGLELLALGFGRYDNPDLKELLAKAGLIDLHMYPWVQMRCDRLGKTRRLPAR